jgi:hypothetical protein
LGLIKPLGTSTASRPNIVVLDKAESANEPLWQNEPVITLGTSVKLVVEVVSTNWQNRPLAEIAKTFIKVILT